MRAGRKPTIQAETVREARRIYARMREAGERVSWKRLARQLQVQSPVALMYATKGRYYRWVTP